MQYKWINGLWKIKKIFEKYKEKTITAYMKKKIHAQLEIHSVSFKQILTVGQYILFNISADVRFLILKRTAQNNIKNVNIHKISLRDGWVFLKKVYKTPKNLYEAQYVIITIIAQVVSNNPGLIIINSFNKLS